MIYDGIKVLLSRWGRWAIKRDSRAMGYASVSPMFRDAPRGDSFGDAVPLGIAEADILAVDAAVMRLPDVHRTLIIYIYQRDCSLRAAADRLGVSHQSAGKYLNEAHNKIVLDIEIQCDQNRASFDMVHQCARKQQPAEA